MKTRIESCCSRALVLLFALAVFWLARPATAAPVTFCLEGEICPVCGDGVCDVNELCPEDCDPSAAVCGNGICDGVETCSSCGVDCGACPGGDPGDGGGEPPHETVEHSGAATEALKGSSCAKSAGVTAREAQQWMNAADCLNNECAGNADLTAPGGSQQLRDATWNGICWACRNPDHFTSNTAFNWYGLGQLAPTGFSRDWTPLNNVQAQSALMAQALSLAQSADTDEKRKAALKVAFQACHYATDRTACGHGLGNVFCDPTGAFIASECRNFVLANAHLLSSGDQLILARTPTVCSGGTVLAGESWLADSGWMVGRSCGVVLRAAGWQPSEGLALAAQERLIRHRGAGQQLSDGTRNTCDPACHTGECLPGHPSPPQDVASGDDTAIVAQACSALLAQTCAAMPARPKVAHKLCDHSGPLGLGRVMPGDCFDAVPLPNSPSYGEQTYPNCVEALAARDREPDPPSCVNSPAGGTGGPVGFGGPNDHSCHACADYHQQCGYAVCPGGGIDACGSCSSPLVCNAYGSCDNPGGTTTVACQTVECGWDTAGGGPPICCDQGCPGNCPTYGASGGGGGGTGGGNGGDGGCDAAGYWSDGGCWDSVICTGKSVFLADGTECFE